VVSIYPSLEAAAAGPPVPPPLPLHGPPGSLAGDPAAGAITPAVLWQLVDALGDGLVLTREDGRIALVNRRGAEMFGYQREELIGLPVDALVPPDMRAAHRGYRAVYGRDPRSRPMGDRARLAGLRKDGVTFPAEISLSPCRPPPRRSFWPWSATRRKPGGARISPIWPGAPRPAAHRSPRTCWTAWCTGCSRSGSACRMQGASRPRWPRSGSAPRWTIWTRRFMRSATTRSAAAGMRPPGRGS
jgi:PAS domain S-box-containing protein